MLRLISIFKFIGEYFRYKNKQLWTGQLVNGGQITIPNIDKYDSIALVVSTDQEPRMVIYRCLNNNFRGGGVLTPWSSGAVVIGQACLNWRSGNTYQLSDDYSGYMGHLYGDGHHGKTTFNSSDYHICEIIGLEPSLQKIVEISRGGGTKFSSILTFRRWLAC